jgi:hypothetical protein
VAAGCGSWDDAAPADTGGRLTLAGGDGEVLLDAPALGSRCAIDSTVAVVAVGSEWSTALALRAPWPVDSPLVLTVAPRPTAVGTAALAVRQVRDTVGAAHVAQRGSPRLEPGAELSGEFEVVAAPQAPAADSGRFVGRFPAMPLTVDLCPGDEGPTP